MVECRTVVLASTFGHESISSMIIVHWCTHTQNNYYTTSNNGLRLHATKFRKCHCDDILLSASFKLALWTCCRVHSYHLSLDIAQPGQWIVLRAPPQTTGAMKSLAPAWARKHHWDMGSGVEVIFLHHLSSSHVKRTRPFHSLRQTQHVMLQHQVCVLVTHWTVDASSFRRSTSRTMELHVWLNWTFQKQEETLRNNKAIWSEQKAILNTKLVNCNQIICVIKHCWTFAFWDSILCSFVYGLLRLVLTE